jgi:hypothetical protein
MPGRQLQCGRSSGSMTDDLCQLPTALPKATYLLPRISLHSSAPFRLPWILRRPENLISITNITVEKSLKHTASHRWKAFLKFLVIFGTCGSHRKSDLTSFFVSSDGVVSSFFFPCRLTSSKYVLTAIASPAPLSLKSGRLAILGDQ